MGWWYREYWNLSHDRSHLAMSLCLVANSLQIFLLRFLLKPHSHWPSIYANLTIIKVWIYFIDSAAVWKMWELWKLPSFLSWVLASHRVRTWLSVPETPPSCVRWNGSEVRIWEQPWCAALLKNFQQNYVMNWRDGRADLD